MRTESVIQLFQKSNPNGEVCHWELSACAVHTLVSLAKKKRVDKLLPPLSYNPCPRESIKNKNSQLPGQYTNWNNLLDYI